MKKYRSLLLAFCICFLFPFTVFASQKEHNYDFRKDSMLDSEDYDNICKLQDEILQGQGKKTEIDFSAAIRVLSYTAEDILPLLKDENLIHSIQQNMEYCWKIPIEDRDMNSIDYAVAYTNADGEWSYYTASADTETGKNQVQYVFDTSEITQILSESNIHPQQLYAITVSEIYADFIIVDTGAEPLVIPYAARPEFLNLTNKQVYGAYEIYEKVAAHLSESSYEFAQETVDGEAEEHTKITPIIYIGIALLLIGAVYGIFHKRLTKS